MLHPFTPELRDRAADAFLGEVPEDLISDRLFYACELVERYVTDLALDIALRLDLGAALAGGVTAAGLLRDRGFSEEEAPALRWLLRRLAERGEIEELVDPRSGAEPVYRAPDALRTPELAELRAIGLELEPTILPTLLLLEAAADAFPAVVAGRTSGEQALFSGSRMQLWVDYFHNANSIYALNNRIAAVAAANRLPARPGLRLLEVGAGAGSAAEALLEELERRGRLGEIAEYRLTEPNAFLRRRATRALAARFPGLALADQAFDLDLDCAPQGLEDESFDLVLAVNVLHIARDLAGSLGRLRGLLRPGGWLVAGECLRLFEGQTIGIELVFQQLRSFTRVELDPQVRPAHGFLSPAQWRRALEAGRFTAIAVTPDLERLRDHYARFFTGAISGQRPQAEQEF